MKLFLASAADKTIHLLSELSPTTGKKVLFVTNAADPYPGPHFWVENDRSRFIELGYQLEEINLRNVTSESFQQHLSDADILHICGGSVYYITNLIRERGLENNIMDAITNDEIVYTGTSAGAIIVSKNIKAFSYDEEETEYIQKIPDHRGLGLIDFTVVPHCNNPDFIPGHEKMVANTPNDPTPLIFVDDDWAVWVDGEGIKIMS